MYFETATWKSQNDKNEKLFGGKFKYGFLIVINTLKVLYRENPFFLRLTM